MGLESHSLLLPCQNPGVRAVVRTGTQSAEYTVARAAIPNEGETRGWGTVRYLVLQPRAASPAAASCASSCRSVLKPTAKAVSNHSN